MADQVRVTIDGVPLNAMVVADAGSSETASAIGAADDPAWNGTDGSASLISIMKAIYAQNETIIANTTPAG